MTILLLRPYATFAQGETVDLDNATEAALVAQGRASYVGTSLGGVFAPLTAAEQQNVMDSGAATAGNAMLTAAQVAALTGSNIFASLALTAGATGLRQAVGEAVAVRFTASAAGSIYYRWTDALAAIGVAITDPTVDVNAAAPVVLTVPAGMSFFEYMRVGGSDVPFVLGLSRV